MKYEIELPGAEQLTEMVIESVSNTVLHGSEYQNGVRDKIAGRAADAVTAKIEAEVNAIVEAHLEKAVQPTNEFGEPTGEPVTLRARIAKQVTAHLEEKVDREGRVKAADYHDKDRRTRAEWAIARAVEEIATKELREAVAKAGAEVKAQITGKVTEATATTIKKLLGLP